jgi:WD40 repeat protein
VRIWDAATGKPIGQPLTGHLSAVFGVAYSPDGKRMVSGSNDTTVRIWDVETGQAIGQPLTGHALLVCGVAFSPDGRRIVTGGYDGTVRMWDADTGEPIGAPLTGHTSAVEGVAFTPDGKRVASGSEDMTLRVWEPGNVAPMTGHTTAVDSVAFSPDGKRIVSGSFDNTLLLWDAVTGKPIGQPLTGRVRPDKGVLPAVLTAKQEGWPAVVVPIENLAEARHACASLAISAGVNVLALQRMLGHTSAKVTLDTYSDLFDTDLDAVAQSLHARYSPENVGKLWARSE